MKITSVHYFSLIMMSTICVATVIDATKPIIRIKNRTYNEKIYSVSVQPSDQNVFLLLDPNKNSAVEFNTDKKFTITITDNNTGETVISAIFDKPVENQIFILFEYAGKYMLKDEKDVAYISLVNNTTGPITINIEQNATQFTTRELKLEPGKGWGMYIDTHVEYRLRATGADKRSHQKTFSSQVSQQIIVYDMSGSYTFK